MALHQGQAALQPVAGALEMGPRERAMYLKQPRRAPNAALQYEEAADATLAGAQRRRAAVVAAAGRNLVLVLFLWCGRHRTGCSQCSTLNPT